MNFVFYIVQWVEERSKERKLFFVMKEDRIFLI